MLTKTLKKFGFPDSLIKEYNHWILLLRPEQVTLGSLVLICKDRASRFSDITNNSFNEYPFIIREIEKNLNKLFKYDKINYLMLMMVDPDVHFHIIPRYSENKQFGDMMFKDFGWPNFPILNKANSINKEIFLSLKETLKSEFEDRIQNSKKYNIVYTTGAYDLFHYGHLNILKKSKEIANYLIVGVSTDELILKAKGHKPIVPFEKRVEILKSIKYIDKVIPQIDKDKQRIVNEYGIDAITVGDDWKGKYPAVSCKLIYFPYTKEISSTFLKNNLDEKELSKHK